MHIRRTLIALPVLLEVVAAVAATSVCAALPPRLELDPRQLAIVEPWRYDEERRFEAGWNRGADVAPARGIVRAPVAGRVRFTGWVAGRLVTTFDARVSGLPVVVTLTGLDRVVVRAGDELGAGQVVGHAIRLHVGAYDPERRSRYLPVVAAAVSAAAARRESEGAGDRIAGAMAWRLTDAIAGSAVPIVPDGSSPSVGGAVDPEPVGATARPGGAPTVTAARLAVTSVRLGTAIPAMQPGVRPRRPTAPRAMPSTPAHAVQGQIPEPNSSAPSPASAVVPTMSARAGSSTGPHLPTSVVRGRGGRQRTIASATRPTSRREHATAARRPSTPPVAPWSDAPAGDDTGASSADAPRMPPLPMPELATVAAGTSDAAASPEDARSGDRETARQRPDDHAAPWRTPVAVLTSVLVAIRLLRRRRRVVQTTSVHQPLPPLLPHAHRPHRASTYVPRPVDWLDVESGTSTNDPPTTPPARARSPEHA